MSGISFTIGDGDDKTKTGPAPKSASAPKRGPGRPPASAAKTKADVESALSAMQGLYQAASMGLLIIGRTRTASFLAGELDQLQAANRTAFESSPKLAAFIAGAGQVTGVGMFFVANVTVAAKVALAVREEGILIRQEMAEQSGGES